jgi:hypothetical protein
VRFREARGGSSVILTHEQLKAILTAGGGLVVEAPLMTVVQLRALCTAAAAGGGSLTIKHCSALGAPLLVELAALAPRRVAFDLSG